MNEGRMGSLFRAAILPFPRHARASSAAPRPGRSEAPRPRRPPRRPPAACARRRRTSRSRARPPPCACSTCRPRAASPSPSSRPRATAAPSWARDEATLSRAERTRRRPHVWRAYHQGRTAPLRDRAAPPMTRRHASRGPSGRVLTRGAPPGGTAPLRDRAAAPNDAPPLFVGEERTRRVLARAFHQGRSPPSP